MIRNQVVKVIVNNLIEFDTLFSVLEIFDIFRKIIVISPPILSLLEIFGGTVGLSVWLVINGVSLWSEKLEFIGKISLAKFSRFLINKDLLSASIWLSFEVLTPAFDLNKVYIGK